MSNERVTKDKVPLLREDKLKVVADGAETWKEGWVEKNEGK